MVTVPKASKARRKDNPEARMSIGDHLRELRNRIVISAIAIVVGSIVGYFLYDPAFALITRPISQANAKGANLSLNFGTVLSSFDIRLRVSIWLGFILSSPMWMYQFWAFVGPGMTRKEKRYAWLYCGIGALLFLAGVALGIWILPHAIDILTGFIPAGATTGFIDASPYLSFVTRIILVFGLTFLLPEVLVAINQLGLVKGRTLLRGWRWAVVGIVALMAVANPLPDPWSMIFMSIPIIGLYFGACGIAIAHDNRLAKRRAALDAELDAALARPSRSAIEAGPESAS
ncbi:twin arginine-targeting protein translocase TatC [Actinomyces sp. Chiba101]|uniref:Sec-independent protein translocase protein TatC n=1 Tax=Actinomyces denticolens TaxID=52767 RepID=A0ABY1I674_9ACTO|nr:MULTISPECIES: twin-arginine translocase subunit TatC [Actinomyces]BAW93110.1 twin arginine-targeting protein translocase TatC [Actinomyces sp. Chiba101]GAV95660.1 twin arginine-targeting protein translocase TatC [Actinomyces denticolens]SHI64721.1 sec-independent protein translocase protein TatC [Actinomyces denticolens]SUU04974.1 Sec-independent protein translocase protein TatCy [Actinomyces denticolens]